MTKAARLKREALQACRFRGHVMSRFKDLGHKGFDAPFYRGVFLSTCKICDRQAVVRLRPSPNEIDIGGQAVALGCVIPSL